MATPKKPTRSWNIDDLLDLGKISGATYLRGNTSSYSRKLGAGREARRGSKFHQNQGAGSASRK
jgi:hypothetical protein